MQEPSDRKQEQHNKQRPKSSGCACVKTLLIVSILAPSMLHNASTCCFATLLYLKIIGKSERDCDRLYQEIQSHDRGCTIAHAHC